MLIKLFEDYIATLSKKKNSLDTDAISALNKYSNHCIEIVNELEDYNDKSDPDTIIEIVITNILSSIDIIDTYIDSAKSIDMLNIFMDEYKTSITFISDDIFKKVDKIENNKGIAKAIKSMYYIYNDIVNKEKIEYSEKLDDTRANYKKYLDNIKANVESKLTNFNIEDVLNTSNIDKDGNSSEITYNAGDSIKYKMSNGDINTAFISNNQENLKDTNNIRLYNNNAEQFEIDKSNIIEVVRRSGDITSKIKDDIKTIAGDSKKIKKLSAFLDELKNSSE